MVLCCTREWPDGLTQMFPGIKRCRCAASTLSSLSSPPSASVRRTNISEPASTLLLWNHCWRFFRDSGSRVSDSGSRVSETLEPSRLLCSSLPTVQGFGYCSAHPTEPCTTPAPSRGRLLTAQMRMGVQGTSMQRRPRSGWLPDPKKSPSVTMTYHNIFVYVLLCVRKYRSG